MSLNERLLLARRSREASPRDQRVNPAPGNNTQTTAVQDDPHRSLKQTVHASLVDSLGPKLYDTTVTEDDLAQLVQLELHAVLTRNGTPLSVAERASLTQQISDNILGCGPLEPYLRDGEISEIMVNGPSVIYVERGGSLHRVNAAFADETHLRRTIDKIVAGVGRRVDEASPMVDARLPDGSRINAVVPPLAVDGPSLTIRKFAPDPYT
ncbi:MAG: ATPase, T2SS/T4P/T4SS family, partial [Actinomycetes bacterium]